MKKSYVMAYSSTFSDEHKKITDILDKIDPHGDWHAPMPHCLFFNSELTAHELAQKFESELGVGPGKLYLITEVSDNKQGRLESRGWRLLNDPNNPRGL